MPRRRIDEPAHFNGSRYRGDMRIVDGKSRYRDVRRKPIGAENAARFSVRVGSGLTYRVVDRDARNTYGSFVVNVLGVFYPADERAGIRSSRRVFLIISRRKSCPRYAENGVRRAFSFGIFADIADNAAAHYGIARSVGSVVYRRAVSSVRYRHACVELHVTYSAADVGNVIFSRRYRYRG